MTTMIADVKGGDKVWALETGEVEVEGSCLEPSTECFGGSTTNIKSLAMREDQQKWPRVII